MLEGPDLTTRYILERSNIIDQSELLYNASMYWFDVSVKRCEEMTMNNILINCPTFV